MTRPKAAEQPVQIASLAPCVMELERAVRWAYAFTGDRDKESPAVTVVIQSKGQRSMCAWFSEKRWSTREGALVHEITMCAEFLHEDPVQIVGTVMHEVAHLWNNDAGIKDCSDSGRHNKKFKNTAEEMFGLEVENIGSRGWASTKLTKELRERIEKEFKPDFLAFDLARRIIEKPKDPSSMAKWTCPGECQIVRVAAKQELDATCDRCQEKFERRD
jgi:hypothetical protein